MGLNLHELWMIFLARWRVFAATLLITVITATIVTLLLPKTFTATTSVIVDIKDDQSLGLQTNGAAYQQPGYLDTQVEIIASHKVALKVVSDLKLANNPTARENFEDETHGKGNIQDWLADLLLKKLDVNKNHSSVVEVSYSAPDGRFAALIANAFAQAYIDTNLELRVEPARQSSQWFNGQLKQLRENLEKAQARLTSYQKDHGIVSVDERVDVENTRHSEISSQLVQAQAETYQTASRQQQAEDFIARGRPLDSLPEVLSNSFIQRLKGDLATSETKLHDAEEQYGKNHPRYQRQVAEVAALREQLKQEIDKVMASITTANKLNQRREAELQAAFAGQKQKVLGLKQRHDELGVLLHDAEIAQNAYDEAAKRYRQATVESQISKTNVAVLNPAVEPLTAARPRVWINILLSVLVGTMLGTAGIFLLELLDRRVRSGAECARELGVPLLVAMTTAKEPPHWLRGFYRLFARWNVAGA